MKRRLLLDTDIGTDVDDCLALALALSSPEVELAGVTTVYGDVLLRARMAMKLLCLAGRDSIPVAAGAAQPLNRQLSAYWEGHEGVGLLENSDLALQPSPEHAADFIIRIAFSQPGEIWLAAIGPLTNLALALLKEPALGQALAGVTVMGGVVGAPGPGHLPLVEHNFGCDPEAAQIVLTAGFPVYVVPLDVTTQVRIERPDVAAIAAEGGAFREAVARQVEVYPKFSARGGWTYLHDPLALATIIAPELVGWGAGQGQVSYGPTGDPGRFSFVEADTGSLNTALRVNSDTAKDWIIRRLIAGPVQPESEAS